MEMEQKKIVYLPVEELYPHPDNPRKDLGDLSELTESIKVKGVLQNLTVIPGRWEGAFKASEDGYTIIIGHRRHAAAVAAGLRELPCIVTEMDRAEQLETMLLENLQRVDLTVYEQARGFQMMFDLGFTETQIAEKAGFSRHFVHRRLKMAELDQKKLQEISGRQITIADFDKLEKIEDVKKRNKLLEQIGTYNFDNSVKTVWRAQEYEKKVKSVEKDLKKIGAQKMKSRWQSGFEEIARIDLEKDYKGLPLKEDEKREIYYYPNEYTCDVTLHVKAQKTKKAKEKKSKAALKREADIKETVAQLKQMTKRHRELRDEFIKKAVVLEKHRAIVMYVAARIILTVQLDTYTNAQRDGLGDVLGIEGYKDLGYEKKSDAAKSAIAKLGAQALPKVLYWWLTKDDDKYYSYYNPDAYPTYQKCKRLDLIYELLCALGYECSDEEQALMSGGHELLNKNKVKK